MGCLIRKIFEADPLVCACGACMRIVSFITDPRTIDRILRHRESERCKAKDFFETASSAGRPCPRFPLILGRLSRMLDRHPAGRGVRGPPGRPRPAKAPPLPLVLSIPLCLPE